MIQRVTWHIKQTETKLQQKCGGPIYSEFELIDRRGNKYGHETVVVGVTKDIYGNEWVIYTDFLKGKEEYLNGFKRKKFNEFSALNKNNYTIPTYKNQH